MQDLYRLSRCKTPLPLSVMKKFGSPLPADQVEVLEAGLHWDDFQVRHCLELSHYGAKLQTFSWAGLVCAT